MLVHTDVYADGHTEVTYEDLGVICSSCPPKQLCDHLDGGTGGGGFNLPVGEDRTRAVKWPVAGSPGEWVVTSYEKLYGKKFSDGARNYFTNISHTGSHAFNFVAPGVTWLEISNNPQLENIDNDGHYKGASNEIIGKVTNPYSYTRECQSAKTWSSTIL